MVINDVHECGRWCGHEKSPGGEARASDAVLTNKELVKDSVTRVKDFVTRVRTKRGPGHALLLRLDAGLVDHLAPQGDLLRKETGGFSGRDTRTLGIFGRDYAALAKRQEPAIP